MEASIFANQLPLRSSHLFQQQVDEGHLVGTGESMAGWLPAQVEVYQLYVYWAACMKKHTCTDNAPFETSS